MQSPIVPIRPAVMAALSYATGRPTTIPTLWAEHDSGWTARLVVPGVAPEHIDVTVHHGALRVAVRTSEDSPPRQLSWTLPETAQGDVRAQLSRGVLVLTVPKTPPEAPTKVEVVEVA